MALTTSIGFLNEQPVRGSAICQKICKSLFEIGSSECPPKILEAAIAISNCALDRHAAIAER
jgi:hypothetical protein